MPSRLEQLKELCLEHPEDPFFHYGIAMELLSSDNFEEAKVQLIQVTEQFPGYIPAWHMLGQLLVKLGEENAACLTLQKGIEQAIIQKQTKAKNEMQSLLDEISED
jgi:predicted Zn-dependent protease